MRRSPLAKWRAGDVDDHALQGANLAVAKGEFVSVVGASGSGKSTLFNILGTLTPPTSAIVRIDGKDLQDPSNANRIKLRRSTVGFVFQKYNLLPTLTAEDNIRIVQFIGNGTTHFTPEFQQILTILGIADRMKHKPRGQTILMITHDQEAASSAARSIHMRDGQIL